MQRNHVWHFHNPRLSVAQSGMRRAISHSQTGSGGAALMLSRVANWAKGLFDIHRTTVPAVGVCGGEPVMKAFGTVLDQIDSGAIKDADAACAAFVYAAAQSQAPAAPAPAQPGATAPQATPAAQPASLGAGSVSAGLKKDCMDLVAQYLLAWVFDDQSREKQIESEFKESSCDPGWLVALNAWLLFYWDGKPPVYNPPSEGTVPIPLPPAGDADGLLRVGILGDWGTGEPEAIAVLDQLMQLEPDLIIHLGDIYYAGTFDECRTNFLIPIQAARAKYGNNLPVYNIPGNHDYYSGGKGFFAILPLINQGVPNASVQENSFLCLQNDRWQLQCMDTGYNDHDLKDVAADITHLEQAETEWHQSQLLAAGSRKIILISHHQLFSAFATIGTGYQNPFLTKNLADWPLPGFRTSRSGSGAMSICSRSTHRRRATAAGCRCWADASATERSRSSITRATTTSSRSRRSRFRQRPGFLTATFRRGSTVRSMPAASRCSRWVPKEARADYYQVDFTGDIDAATGDCSGATRWRRVIEPETKLLGANPRVVSRHPRVHTPLPWPARKSLSLELDDIAKSTIIVNVYAKLTAPCRASSCPAFGSNRFSPGESVRDWRIDSVPENLDALLTLRQVDPAADIVKMTTEAGSGHPSSSLSATEVMTALYFGGFLRSMTPRTRTGPTATASSCRRGMPPRCCMRFWRRRAISRTTRS